MKKISFIIGGMTRGGAERVISILANQYAKDGWDVDIVMMLDYVVKYELDERINLINMTVDKKNKFKSAPKWVISFRSYVRKRRPDVIVSFVARINIVVLLSTLGMRVPIVISERNDPFADGRSKGIDILTKVLYPKAKVIVFQTKRALNHFSGGIRKLGIIIPNPISTECCASHSTKKIVSVGRLAPQKNQKMLIEAFSEFVKYHNDYSLYIYGEGSLRRELEQLIKNLKLENNVFLPGNVPDIHHQIADAEMFVLSSDYEGLSNALLEAMMMGLPCISTKCAGSDEIISDGYNGLLVPVGDKEKLVQAMVYLIENPDKRQEFINKGKVSVERCRASIVLKQWKDVIEV